LATRSAHAISLPTLIEVYPHPALVELTAEPKRLPYKIGRARGYCPELTPSFRKSMIAAEWESIVEVLEHYVSGVKAYWRGRQGAKTKDYKAHEDVLDAIVCCVCAIRALEGEADIYGDDDAAIWVPRADPVVTARALLPSSPSSSRAEMRLELYAERLIRGDLHRYNQISGRSASKVGET